MKNLTTYKLLDIASLIIIGLVLFIVGMFLYVRFSPVDVINNKTWVLCTAPLTNHHCETGTPDFHVGDTVPIYINSDKVKNVGGFFTTSAECKNKSGVFVSYPISESHVNRAKGHVETEIDTKVPDKIPNLPTTCRIAYVLEYSIFSFRSFSEYNFSNEFILLPADTSTSSITNITYFTPQSTPAPRTPQQSASSISPQNTNSNTIQNQQPNTGQGNTPQPSTVQTITRPVVNLYQMVVRNIRGLL